MERNKKRLIIIGTILLLIIMGISIISDYASRVHWKYDDKWIIGSSKEEIVNRYGEFDIDFNAYFLYKDNGFLGSGLDMYYYIVFDIEGRAIEVYVGRQPGG